MKRIIYSIAILAALAFCLWLVLRQPTHKSNKNVAPQPPPVPTNAIANQVASNAPSQKVSTANALVRPASVDEDSWNRLMQARQMILDQNQPIEFYARVIDQNDQPVEGAKLQITLSRINEKMFETTNFFHMQMGDEIVHLPMALVSDADGWIRVTGITGNSLWLESLSKEGYSGALPNIGSFLYEPNGQHRVGYAGMEDAFNPEKGYVFHLQKE